jgi:hypothetical protein
MNDKVNICNTSLRVGRQLGDDVQDSQSTQIIFRTTVSTMLYGLNWLRKGSSDSLL